METQRLILFVGLGLVLFLLWDAWQKQFHPQPLPANGQPAAVTQSGNVPASDVPQGSATTTSPAGAVPGSASPTTIAPSGKQVIVETDVFRALIDTAGGTLSKVELLQYPVDIKTPDNPTRLMDNSAKRVFIAQSGFTKKPQAADGSLLEAPNHTTVFQSEKSELHLKDDNDTVSLDLTWTSTEGVEFIKRYTFTRGSYLIQVDHIIRNPTDILWRGDLYQQLKRSKEEGGGHMFAMQTYTGGVIWDSEEKYQKISFGDMDDEKLKKNITGGWLAMIEHYFVGAWVPDKTLEYTYYTNVRPNEVYELGMKAVNETQVAAGATTTLNNQYYVGPKIQSDLEEIAEGLELTVDYGLLTIISKPLFWLLEWIHSFVGNWGWAIIILTLLIKLAFYKLSETSYKSMANMRKLTPRLKAMKERYGDDKQAMQKAQMELFRKEKINPLGGCLPILVQIPVFIALYFMLMESVELRQAPWILWIEDLSIKDPYYVLPIIMGVTMFVQQKLNPAPMDPMQAKVMMALPFVFTVFFLFFPAGLVLYWVVNNTLSILQQWYITRVVVKS